MAPSEILTRFMNDPYPPKVLVQSQQGPELQQSPITTIPSEPGLSLKDQRVFPKPASSEPSTSPSTSPSPSILSRRESESSNTSIAPSDVVDDLIGDVATMSMGGNNHRLPCLLKYIAGCPVSFQESERESWYLHSLSHYGEAGPPTHAMCIFCHTIFNSNDPFTCWSKRMDHIADHFEMNRTIEKSRPDFRVIEDMFNKGCISEEDYKHCFAYSERPPCDGLRPHDYIPEEHKKKQRAAHEQANRVVVKESRQESREWARGNRLLGSKKSKSKATIVK